MKPPSRARGATPRRPLVGIAAASVALAVVAAGWLWWMRAAPERRADVAPPAHAEFVGSETCASCHQPQARLWQASQHRHAMAHADTQSVRGDFNDVTIEYNGIRSRFYRDGDRYMVETDGVGGRIASFEVTYTFGVDPLQQYLVAFPDGRIQALPFAWDTRPKADGGQRWFHLYPAEKVTHDDPLHWTRPSQNWNFMCAECHSTGVHKNYDAATNHFATTFAEISVGCEACHGAGSRHVAWAKGGQPAVDAARGLAAAFDERAGVTWTTDGATGLPHRGRPPETLRKEVETCGLCHARRSQQSEDFKPGHWLSDTHWVAPLERRILQADGQMRDDEETYNYASFKQSRMFAAGVTCSDCHDPHAATLKAPGDAVCGQCHAPESFATAAHHHHAEAGGAAPGCAACHMPAHSYMVVDRRHDHGFRIPRPDLSVKLGTSNACTDCHRDKPAQWAADAVQGWFGPQRKGFQTWGAAFDAAWRGEADATEQLAAVVSAGHTPGYVRAAALSELGAAGIVLARAALDDPDPVVRIGALDALDALPDAERWPLAAPRLSDPVRGVRIRAAELLAAASRTRPPAERTAFDRAAAEFVSVQQLAADRPEAHATLGTFLARQGRMGEAEQAYRAALELDPRFTAAAIDLADLYRESGRDGEGAGVLRAALVVSPSDASLHHALGLALVRLKSREAAFDELRRAAVLDSQNARYTYVYAVALQSSGRLVEALAAVKEGLGLHPNDRALLDAAVSFSRQAGRPGDALTYAERLARLEPQDAELARLVEELRRDAAAPR